MGFVYRLSLFDPTDEPCKGIDTRRLNDVGQVKTLIGESLGSGLEKQQITRKNVKNIPKRGRNMRISLNLKTHIPIARRFQAVKLTPCQTHPNASP